MQWIYLLIPILALLIPILTIWSGHRRRMLDQTRDPTSRGATARETQENIDQLMEKNAELEARVQTLETIVTLDAEPRDASRVRINAEDRHEKFEE